MAKLPGDVIVEAAQPHGLRLSNGFYSHDGIDGDRLFHGQFGLSEEVKWNTVRIRHYTIKSRLEFETKRRRGRADAIDRSLSENYFPYRDRNEVHAPLNPLAFAALENEIEQIKGKLAQTPKAVVPDVDLVSTHSVLKN